MGWDGMRVLSLLLDTHSRYGVIAVTVPVLVLVTHCSHELSL